MNDDDNMFEMIGDRDVVSIGVVVNEITAILEII